MSGRLGVCALDTQQRCSVLVSTIWIIRLDRVAVLLVLSEGIILYSESFMEILEVQRVGYSSCTCGIRMRERRRQGNVVNFSLGSVPFQKSDEVFQLPGNLLTHRLLDMARAHSNGTNPLNECSPTKEIALVILDVLRRNWSSSRSFGECFPVSHTLTGELV